jgi:hypothetical protein
MRTLKRGDCLYVPDYLQSKGLLKQLHVKAWKITETLIKCKKKLMPQCINEMEALLEFPEFSFWAFQQELKLS